jgi:hypothetical protein
VRAVAVAIAITGLLALALPAAGLAATAQSDAPPTELWERFPIDPAQPDASGSVTLGEAPPLEESAPPPPGSAAPSGAESAAGSDSGSDDLLLWGAGVVAALALAFALVMWLRRPRRGGVAEDTDEASDTTATTVEPPYPATSEQSPAVTATPPPVEAPAPEPAPPALPSFEVPLPAGTASSSSGDPFYDDPTCREFVAGLSTPVLRRSIVLFSALAERETVSASAVAEELEVNPQELPGLLTTPLRRRANALGVPLPYVIARHSSTGRRSWSDEGGIARRLEQAARAADAERAGATPERTDAPAPPSMRPPSRRA